MGGKPFCGRIVMRPYDSALGCVRRGDSRIARSASPNGGSLSGCPAHIFSPLRGSCPVEGQILDGVLHDGAGLLQGGIHVPVEQGGIQPELDLVKLLYAAALAVQGPEIHALGVEGVVQQGHEHIPRQHGQLTGTASTGIILLREIDPMFNTPASHNLIYQNLWAILLGAPMLLPMGFVARSMTWTWTVLGILVLLLGFIMVL